MTTEEMKRYWNNQRKIKSPCQKCGYKVFTEPRGYGICKYCGTKVLGDKLKFKEKMEKIMKEANNGYK